LALAPPPQPRVSDAAAAGEQIHELVAVAKVEEVE
jgi:hypothetical protein